MGRTPSPYHPMGFRIFPLQWGIRATTVSSMAKRGGGKVLKGTLALDWKLRTPSFMRVKDEEKWTGFTHTEREGDLLEDEMRKLIRMEQQWQHQTYPPHSPPTPPLPPLDQLVLHWSMDLGAARGEGHVVTQGRWRRMRRKKKESGKEERGECAMLW